MIFLVALVVLVGLVASMTKLAWDDEITAPLRVGLREKYGSSGFFVRALECPRCTAVWLSPLPTAAALGIMGAALGLSWAWWIVVALAWIPVSFSVAYLAFIMIIRGEA